MSRRKFLETSAAATGAFAWISTATPVFSLGTKNRSAINTKLGVKFFVGDTIHEAAYEDSCRWGDLKNLTFEAETAKLKERLNNLKEELKTLTFPPGVE